MQFMLRVEAMFRDDILCLVDEPVVSNTMGTAPGSPREAVEAELKGQMRRFKKLTYIPDKATQRVVTTISGKTDESGRVAAGQRDDLVIALLLGCYWQNEYAHGRTSRPAVLMRDV